MDDNETWTENASSPSAPDDDLPPELRAVALRYAAQPVPCPTPAATARLLARLLAEEPSVALAAPRQPWPVAQALRVARWRARLLGPWFWIASVLLLGAGAVLTPFVPTYRALPLILLAPLTAVLSIAHAARTSSGGLRAVEASAPVGFVEVTAGLVLAIVGFDCVLGAAATLALALLRWAPFVTLLLAWLGPLLLLAGLSLPIALRWGAIPAATIGGAPWLMLAGIAALQPRGAYALAVTMPQDSLSLALHVLATAVGAALLALLLLRGQIVVAHVS